jgi:hypothetical protein
VVIAVGTWYFAPYRQARKLFILFSDLSDKVFDLEPPRRFQTHLPVLAWIYSVFICLPLAVLVASLLGLLAFTVMVVAAIWPLVLLSIGASS